MFDIGFAELLMIGVIALLVIGPERLPKVARTVGLWVGKGRSMILSVKSEIDQEIRADELKKILEQQAGSQAMEEIEEIVEETRDLKNQVHQETVDINKNLQQSETSSAPPAKTDTQTNKE